MIARALKRDAYMGLSPSFRTSRLRSTESSDGCLRKSRRMEMMTAGVPARVPARARVSAPGPAVGAGVGGAAVTGACGAGVGATGWIVGGGLLLCTGAAGFGGGGGGPSCSAGTTVRWAGTAAAAGRTVRLVAASAWAAPLGLLTRPTPNAQANTMHTAAAISTARASIRGRSLPALGQRLSRPTVFMRSGTGSASGRPRPRRCPHARVGGHDGSQTECTCRSHHA